MEENQLSLKEEKEEVEEEEECNGDIIKLLL